jgi:hypothetical protein
MPKFIISFGARAMDHIPDEEFSAVADCAHAVIQEILDAGAYIFAGGLENRKATVVATNGTVSNGLEPDTIGGFTIVDVSSREEALVWAAKIAVACRCPQEVWEIQHDPQLNAMVQQAAPRI